MIIYPFEPHELDDKTLSQQIKAIAQTLCNVHFLAICMKGESSWAFGRMENDAPLPPKHDHDVFSLWGKQCRANYLKLVDMGLAYCREYNYRNNSHVNNGYKNSHKFTSVILWARDHVPELRGCRDKQPCTPDCGVNYCFWDDHAKNFPLCVPKQHIAMYYWFPEDKRDDDPDAIIQSYRNYYIAKIKKLSNCNCKNCKGMLPKHDPQWTRREKPGWIKTDI